MKLVIKTIIPCEELNSNGSTKGGYLFEIMDYAGVTILNETFVASLPENHVLVTTHANDIKYINSVFAYDYVEVYAEITDISASSATVCVELKNRNKKSTVWETSVVGEFKFSIIDVETRKIVRIPKEVINEIKG